MGFIFVLIFLILSFGEEITFLFFIMENQFFWLTLKIKVCLTLTLISFMYFIFLFLLLNWLFIQLELVISFFYLAYIFFNLHYRLGLFPHLLYLDIINLLVYQKPRTLKHFFSKPYFLLKFQNVENQAINFLNFVFFPQLYLFI